MQIAFDNNFREQYPAKIEKLMNAEEQPYAGIFTEDKDWLAELYRLIKSWEQFDYSVNCNANIVV